MERLLCFSSPTTCFTIHLNHSRLGFNVCSERKFSSPTLPIFCKPETLSPFSSCYSLSAPFHKFSCQLNRRKDRGRNHIFSVSSHVDVPGDQSNLQDAFPAPLDSTSHPPPLFDGTTRLYISYKSPFAQRVWITRNYKGLEDDIKLVPLDLQNRPAWYKEKVYPINKVPSLEHNNKVIGESLDLIKYVDLNFDGPSLFPDDSAKRKFSEELLSYSETFNRIMYATFKGNREEVGPAFDHLESALHKFDEGPFFLGQFSLVDIAFIPLVERLDIFLVDVWNYDIREGRPILAAWIEELNKIDAYKQTKYHPKELVDFYKKRFLVQQPTSNFQA